MPDDRLAAAVAELYGAAPEGFTERRTELAAAARDAGDRAAAKAIGALRRPTRAAWIVNQLARTDPSAPGQLAELAGALRAAQEAKHGPRLRELSAARGALVDALTAQALTTAGLPDPPASLRLEVSETLTAALADPSVAAAFAEGTLTRAMQWSGFGVLPADADSDADEAGAAEAGAAEAGAASTAASGAGRPQGAATAAREADADGAATQSRRRDGGREPSPGKTRAKPVLTEVAQPRRRAGQAGTSRNTEAAAARRQAAEADSAALAEERAAQRREQHAEAERAVAAASSAAAEALSAEDQLEAEVRDLEQRLTKARADLAAARMRARHAEAAERRARQALDRLSLASRRRCRTTHLKEHGIETLHPQICGAHLVTVRGCLVWSMSANRQGGGPGARRPCVGQSQGRAILLSQLRRQPTVRSPVSRS